MLYGIEYVNSFGDPRSAVYNANTTKEASKIFYNKDCHYANGFKIISISEINSDVCSLLFQSYQDIVFSEERNFRTNIQDGELTVEIDDVLSRKTVIFKERDLHCIENQLEVMVCVHDGTPNWLY